MQRTVPADGPMPAEIRQLEFALQQEVNRAQAALEKCCADNRMPADDDRSGVGAAELLFPCRSGAVHILSIPAGLAGNRQVHFRSLLSDPPRYQRPAHGPIPQPTGLALG